MNKSLFIIFCMISFLNLHSQNQKKINNRNPDASRNGYGTPNPRASPKQIEAEKSFKKNGYYLEGRKLIKNKKHEKKCKETGTIIAKIEVNNKGKVTNVLAPIKGSTTMSPCLLKIVKKRALSMVFEKYNGEIILLKQEGKVAFVFTNKK